MMENHSWPRVTVPHVIQRIRARLYRAGEPESGQIMLLSIGFMAIALALISVVITVTAIQLDRDRLWNTADDAARYAAGAIDQDAFYQGSQARHDGVPVTNDSVQEAVDEYLAMAAPSQGSLRQIQVTHAATPDGQTAVVVLEGVSRPTMLGWVLRTFTQSEGVTVHVESSARAW